MTATRALGVMLVYVLFIFSQPAAAAAQDDAFVVEDIQFEGLQRISEGTALNYLPVSVGDSFDSSAAGKAIRALHSAGFFKTVALYRENNVLVVEVQERPSIASFSLEGNQDIDSEVLLDSLREMGLAEGRIFRGSALDMVKQELLRQYHSRGKYGVGIEVEIERLPNNLVDIKIAITEGSVASIRQINIIGNRVFRDEVLHESLKMKGTNWTSWLDDDDAYSEEKLTGDIETLKSYYMDRGYADYNIESAQVTISPTYEDIFITLDIHEGGVYTVGKIKFVGETVLPESLLREYVLFGEGDVFSLARASSSAEFMKSILASKGYGFAEVEPIHQVHEKTNTVDVVFSVQPGKRIYVREIMFSGSHGTVDEVFRREIRQMESTWYIKSLVERSKTRLNRLPFVENAEYETIPVQGRPDLVDIKYNIKERQAGSFLFSIGYGSEIGALINTGISHANFLGTGDYISLNLAKTSYYQNYSVTHREPYSTINGVGRTVSAFYSDSESFVRNSSSLDNKQYGMTWAYSIPMSEYSGLEIGLNGRHSELLTTVYSSQELISFVRNNGDVFQSPFGYGTEFDVAELSAGWYYDTRNRTILADEGSRASFTLDVTLPGSGVQYYSAKYKHVKYVPLPGDFALGFNGEIAWGEPLRDTTVFPPFKNFYAGGPDTVRSFRDNYLGPRDSRGYPLGGALRTYLQSELLLPMPSGGGASGAVRFSIFADVGNVFATPSDFESSELRASAGVAAVWLSPLGAMRFSLGRPLKEQKGDLTESFQFSVGSVF